MQNAVQTGGPAFYPRHNIDPALKDINWGKQYARAAMYDWSSIFPRTVFFNAGIKYEEHRLYAIGKQPNAKYKKWMGVNEQTNNTFMNIDWSIRPVVSKLRDIAIARLIQQEYNIVATPIDPLAKTELDQYYSMMRSKIALRQVLQQQNPELANHPLIAAQPGEPMDMEELEMRLDFGEQFNRSKDAELAIQLALYENDSKLFRQGIFENFFDCGVAGYKEWLGDDGKPKFRGVNPECVITNWCRKKNFKDMQHAGEVIDVPLVDLAVLYDADGNRVFTDKELEGMAADVAGKYTNPMYMGTGSALFKGYDKFKVKVLDLEFFSYNEYNWQMAVDNRGNLQYSRADWGRGRRNKEKYTRKCFKVVYKIKWIIGTDYAYDFGLASDQKRQIDPKKKAETTLSYRFFAPTFYEMQAQSMMERLIPLIDDYQLTCYKVQNIKSRIVPNGWYIDLDALENVALNKGGKNMTPMELLEMFYQTGVLVGRSQDAMANNINWKPVIPIQNTIINELVGLYQDMQNTLSQMQSIVGLNEITDGSTPNPKTLVPGYENANVSTNNALFSLAFGEKWLMEQLANDIVARTQQGLRKGGVEGYAPALNANTLRFIQVNPDISLRDYGVMLDERPTDDQKAMLAQQMQADQAQGFLDTSDIIMVTNTYNIKQAAQMLAYKVKKAKQAKDQQAMAINQQTIQGQQQSVIVSEQAKQQTIQVQLQADLMLEDKKGQWLLRVAQEKAGQLERSTTETNQTKIVNQQLANQAKQLQQTSE